MIFPHFWRLLCLMILGYLFAIGVLVLFFPSHVPPTVEMEMPAPELTR